MSLDIHARVAVLEDQNETCAEERKALDVRVDAHEAWLNQVRGMFRTLVALWGISTALLGLLGVRYVADLLVVRPASAQVTPAP